ncbi:MAG: phosphatidylglycerol lysyltransferase domain-containing protein [Thermotaleaceae bacterium]
MLSHQVCTEDSNCLSNEIRIEDKALFNRYIQSYPYQISDINFTNLFMWRHLYHLRYEIIHDFLCISGYYYGEPFLFPPLTLQVYDPVKLSRALEVLKQRLRTGKAPLKMKFVPEPLLEVFQSLRDHDIEAAPDRDNFDYIYSAEDLSKLQGRRFHSKKNHFNHFKKNTAYEYVPLTPALIDGCMSLTRRLMDDEASPLEKSLLENEEKAIYQALSHMDRLGYTGAAIVIHNQVEAFTLGEKTDNDTLLVHIEKANAEIRGLYQAINTLFCRNECEHITYVNREEDMGFENLRKAKESYHPIKLLEKYDVTIL